MQSGLHPRRVPAASPVPCLIGGFAAVLALATTPGSTRAQVVHVKTEIEGLDKPLEVNARAFLSIVRLERDELNVQQVLNLHERAPKEIARALEPFGYYRAQVEALLAEDGTDWVARYVVDPGPIVRLAHVDLALTGAGASETPLVELVKACPMAPGDSLLHAEYEQFKLALSSASLDLGYLDARFDSSEIRVHRVDSKADVILHLDTGPQFLFGETRFHQDVLDPRLLEGQIPYKRGEPFSFTKVLVLQSALTSGPYFSRVEVRPERERAQGLEVPIEVDLTPSRSQRYEVGVGYGTDTGPRARLGVELRRLNRAGHFAEAEVKFSPLEISATAQYKIPTPYPRTELFTIYTGYGSLRPDWSTSHRTLLGGSVSRLRGPWREVFSLAFEHENFTIADQEGRSNLLIPGAAWTLTHADGKIPLRRGHRVRFETKGAVDGVLSSVSFLQVKADGKIIRGLTTGSRLLGRAELGRTFSPSFNDLPPSLRFVTGGDQTVRGYAYQSLGPTDASGRITGGDLVAVAGLELDQALFAGWSLAGFLDAGNAFRDGPDELEQGAGMGVRWLSPVGLVRLDGAFALSRPGAPFRIHFTIGPDL